MTFRHIKNSVFKTAAFFALILIFTSCGNLFDDVASVITNRTSGGQVVMISGNVSVDYQSMSGGIPAELSRFYSENKVEGVKGRSAIPSFTYSNKSYYVTATAPGYTGTPVVGDVDSQHGTFSIPLTLGYRWTIELGMQKKDDGEEEFVTVFKGTYSYTQPLTEADVSNPVSIQIKPGMTSNGTGNMELPISSSPSGLYDRITSTVENSSQATAWNATTTNINGIM